MRKRLFAAVLVGAFCLGGMLQAKEMEGKFGVGYERTIGGVNGLAVKYWTGNFGIFFDLGFSMISPDDGDSVTGALIGLGALYNVVMFENTNLGVGLLLDLGFVSADETATHIVFELPMRAEYFLSDNFSIFGQVGLVINIISEDGPIMTPTLGFGPAEGIGLGVGAGINATGGFTYYF